MPRATPPAPRRRAPDMALYCEAIRACLWMGQTLGSPELGLLLVELVQGSDEVCKGPWPSATDGKDLCVSGRVFFRKVGMTYRLTPQALLACVDRLVHCKLLQVWVQKNRQELPRYQLQLGAIMDDYMAHQLALIEAHMPGTERTLVEAMYATTPGWPMPEERPSGE